MQQQPCWILEQLPSFVVGFEQDFPREPCDCLRDIGYRPVNGGKLQGCIVVYEFPGMTRGNLNKPDLLRVTFDREQVGDSLSESVPSVQSASPFVQKQKKPALGVG